MLYVFFSLFYGFTITLRISCIVMVWFKSKNMFNKIKPKNMKANEVIRDFYKEVGYPDIEEIVSSSFDEIKEECFRELGLDLDYDDEDRMAEEDVHTNPFDEALEEYFREEEAPVINFEREDRMAERAFCKSRGIRF